MCRKFTFDLHYPIISRALRSVLLVETPQGEPKIVKRKGVMKKIAESTQ